VVMALADSGVIGGDTTHEFHVISPMGEDQLLCCNKCGYVANVEKAKGVSPSFATLHQNSSTAILQAIEVSTGVEKLAQVGGACPVFTPSHTLQAY